MTEFIHAQLTFHARAMELYTAAYQQTQNVREEEIVEVGVYTVNGLLNLGKSATHLGHKFVSKLTSFQSPSLAHTRTHTLSTRPTRKVCTLDSHRTRPLGVARQVLFPLQATHHHPCTPHYKGQLATSSQKKKQKTNSSTSSPKTGTNDHY